MRLTMPDKLNVSLEPHLRDVLTPLLRILPAELSDQLTSTLSSEKSTQVISYELILQISRWSRTTDGTKALQSRSPPLDPQSYTMVSLLAGARTSPDKHFPPYLAKDPEEERRRQVQDRKAIATLVNAVLSVVATGVATWWASERTGLRVEWRALLAIGAALVVAFAEIILYMIWESRQSSHTRQPTQRHRIAVQEKKDARDSTSEGDVAPQASSSAVEDTGLRNRTSVKSPET